MRHYSAILTAALFLLALACPGAWADTYDLAGDWGVRPSIWSYGSGWSKAMSDSPGNWAAGDVIVNLGSWPNASMVTWTSPSDGTMSITGAAWLATTPGPDDVWLQFIPQSLAQSLDFANAHDSALRAGTTALANGTVQNGYSSVYGKNDFGSISIPLRDVSSLADLPVHAGDVVAIVVECEYLYAGNTLGAQLTIAETPVPEPGSTLLLGAGLAGIVWKRRRT